MVLAALAAAPATAWSQTAAQVGTNQDGAKPLPSVTIGPVPASKRPDVIIAPKAAAAPPAASADQPKTLQLRLDPKTGRPLIAQQMQDRAQRKAQPPRSLRAKQPTKQSARQSGKHSGEPSDKPMAKAAARPAVAADRKQTERAQTGGIQIQALGRAKVSAIGLLNAAEGGFGSKMWAGTPLSLVMALLPRLPMETTSPAMQSLRRRLLVSTALSPEDQGNGKAGNLDGSALVALRIGRLAASGDSAAVSQLLKFSPLTMANKDYARIRIEGELLDGNIRAACNMARNYLGGDHGAGQGADKNIIWQKVMAFCLALDGQAAQVELYEQVLYENGVEDDAYFTLLSGLSSGEAEPLTQIARTGPLHLAMLRAARRVIPEGAIEVASPAVLRAIATSPNASLPLRLEAAERAEALGTLPVDVLRRIYASVPFSAEQSADAIALAESQPGPSAAAILYQVTQIDDQVESRARALAAAWHNGRRRGRYLTAVRVNLPQTKAIRPDAALAWFAAPAGRALLMAGDRAAARAWLMAVVPAAQNGEVSAAAAVLMLAPLLEVARGSTESTAGTSTGGAVNDAVLAPITGKVLQGWWQGEVANGRADRYQRATRLFGTLTALGRDLSSQHWAPLFSAPEAEVHQAPAAILLGLERAAAAGQRGEAVLLSLLLLGDQGPGSRNILTLGRVIAALRQVGLSNDADALALEGLVGARF